jgi:hypothetical protein
MTDHITGPLQGAFFSTAGIIAQVSGVPIPDDLKSWPVTAILGLISLGCLGIVAYQIRGTIKTAETLAKVTEKQTTAEGSVKDLTHEVRTLVLELRGRPCIHGR